MPRRSRRLTTLLCLAALPYTASQALAGDWTQAQHLPSPSESEIPARFTPTTAPVPGFDAAGRAVAYW